MTTWRSRAGIGAILLAIACGPHGPALSQSDLRARVDTLAARSDTAALARLADTQCWRTSDSLRQTCYEDYFVALARGDRVTLALAALNVLGNEHDEIARDGHQFTHVIGIRAWKRGDDVAKVFRSCTGLYQSGCYHGVIQAYLLADGNTIDSTRAVQLCDQVAANEADRWLRFQCVHGLGHGFEMAYNWELPKALEGCDILPLQWDRISCYGGAFMENAVASMPGGHHTAVHALQAGGTTASNAPDSGSHPHDMATMAASTGGSHPPDSGSHPPASHSPDNHTITFKMRDSTDALYPCSIVKEQYQFSCYQLQGGVILAQVKGDFAAATKACDKAEPTNRGQCYLSLGTTASGMTVQNTQKIIRHCSNGDPQFQPFCFVGAVKNYVDVTAKPEDGFAFCREVPPGANRMQCWVAVGEEISVLWPVDRDARSKACAKAGADGEAECKRGAGIS